MSRTSLVSSILAISGILIGVNSLSLQPTQALELANGNRVFEGAPRLIRTATSFRSRNNPGATYQFTIEVPEHAGEALKAVRITQKENADTVVFKNDKHRAAEGDSIGGAAIPLLAIGGKSPSGETTVVFDTPIEPGNTVTVAVKPERNPSAGGFYAFGVTVYPTGYNSPGLYIGSGRIYIDQD